MIASASCDAYWREPDDLILPLHQRFDELLSSAVSRFPDWEALVFWSDGAARVRLTYLELAARVDATCRALVASGIVRGDTVAIYSANRPEFVLLQFACSQIGAAVVPVNPLYTQDDLKYVLEKTRCRICFCDLRHQANELWTKLCAIRERLPDLRAVVSLFDDEDRELDWANWSSSGRAADDGTVQQLRSEADAEDGALILFTSGTTGHPKAVQLSGAALSNVARGTAYVADAEDGCRYVHAMPFFHVGGTVVAMGSCIASCGTHIFLPSFSPMAVAAVVDRERATALLAVPTTMISLAEQAQAAGISFTSLRTVLTGGSLVPEIVARHWVDTWNVRISNTYGMTETAGPVVQTSPRHPLDRALKSVGRPLPGVELEVVTIGESGRGCLRRPTKNAVKAIHTEDMSPPRCRPER